jgi:multiple sugar transport system ATP-binding protein
MNFLKGTLRPENGRLLFHETNGPVVVDFTDRPEAASMAGKPATLGIRPEHCTHAADAAPGRFEAVVEVVEPMGAETFLYIHTGAHPLVSRIHEVVARAEAGHRLRFQIDSRQARLFDGVGGGRVA